MSLSSDAAEHAMGREIPGCLTKHEPDAEYAWSSKRRMQVLKGGEAVSLSADDLRGLLRFVETNQIQEQLS